MPIHVLSWDGQSISGSQYTLIRGLHISLVPRPSPKSKRKGLVSAVCASYWYTFVHLWRQNWYHVFTLSVDLLIAAYVVYWIALIQRSIWNYKVKLWAPVESVHEKRLPTGKTITRGNLELHCASVCPFCWRSSLIISAWLLAKALRQKLLGLAS